MGALALCGREFPRVSDPGCNLIGVGAQKCATTWLHFVLKAHPDAFMSEPKELDFFSSFFDRGYEWYDRHFVGGAGKAVRGEISPSYLHDFDAPARAFAYAPAAKVVAVLRDPVDRAFSNHLHEVRNGNCTSVDFEAGMANNPLYLHQSRYALHLNRWLEAFPKEQVKILLQEDIRADPMAVLTDVCGWLGIGWSEAAAFAVADERNASAKYRNERWGSLLHGMAHRLRKSGLGSMVETIKGVGPVNAMLKANRQEMREAVPDMSPQVRLRLAKELLPDMEEVARLLGRQDLPWRSMTLARSA